MVLALVVTMAMAMAVAIEKPRIRRPHLHVHPRGTAAGHPTRSCNRTVINWTDGETTRHGH